MDDFKVLRTSVLSFSVEVLSHTSQHIKLVTQKSRHNLAIAFCNELHRKQLIPSSITLLALILIPHYHAL